MITRNLTPLLSRSPKSILLLGPRQVGKSTLIGSLKPDLTINLANELEFLSHSSDPAELSRVLSLSKARTVFVDEVQRLPRILNTVQALIDADKKLKFFLTGSSARKLKRGQANLLPGRTVNYLLGPLVASELDYKMDTKRLLSLGSLPEIYLNKDISWGQKILSSYVATYLKEEIKAEALTRNLESFARFLTESVLSVGTFVDYTKMAKRAKISRHAVPRHFEILEDTMMGQRIFPFPPLLEKEDLIRHPKFFLFDPGIYNGLLGNFTPSLDRLGILAEQLLFAQLYHSACSKDKSINLFSFRTRRGEEIDFVLELEKNIIGIEVKHSDQVSGEDFAGLEYFRKAYPKNKGLFLLHLGTKEKKLGPFWQLPWQRGLEELGL